MRAVDEKRYSMVQAETFSQQKVDAHATFGSRRVVVMDVWVGGVFLGASQR
jgi:hypothetical protein